MLHAFGPCTLEAGKIREFLCDSQNVQGMMQSWRTYCFSFLIQRGGDFAELVIFMFLCYLMQNIQMDFPVPVQSGGRFYYSLTYFPDRCPRDANIWWDLIEAGGPGPQFACKMYTYYSKFVTFNGNLETYNVIIQNTFTSNTKSIFDLACCKLPTWLLEGHFYWGWPCVPAPLCYSCTLCQLLRLPMYLSSYLV